MKYKVLRNTTCNEELADEYYEHFVDLYGELVTTTSRHDAACATKSLMYNVFRIKCGMTDEAIKEYLLSKGFKRDRSTILIGRKKIDDYYSAFEYFRPMYDRFFSNKWEGNSRDTKNPLKRFNNIMKDLSKSELNEIYELIELRVKSWSWKNKDECTIIEGASPLDNTF